MPWGPCSGAQRACTVHAYRQTPQHPSTMHEAYAAAAFQHEQCLCTNASKNPNRQAVRAHPVHTRISLASGLPVDLCVCDTMVYRPHGHTQPVWVSMLQHIPLFGLTVQDSCTQVYCGADSTKGHSTAAGGYSTHGGIQLSSETTHSCQNNKPPLFNVCPQ
jgi:hypothetical protein